MYSASLYKGIPLRRVAQKTTRDEAMSVHRLARRGGRGGRGAGNVHIVSVRVAADRSTHRAIPEARAVQRSSRAREGRQRSWRGQHHRWRLDVPRSQTDTLTHRRQSEL